MPADDHASSHSGSAKLTRRQVLHGLALTASATSLAGAKAAAVTSDANDKVRAVLESLVRDTPEIGLQAAALSRRRARHRRVGRHGRRRLRQARRRRHAVHGVVDAANGVPLVNYGYINGELLRCVDGRPIAQFLQEEICEPLGIDGARVLPEARLRAGVELQSYEWDEIYRIRARRAATGSADALGLAR